MSIGQPPTHVKPGQGPARMKQLVDTQETEHDLIARAQRGDAGAFNQLVGRYQRSAYNIAYRLVGDPDSAADATQDAFASAFRNLRSFRGGSFRAWLFRIVSNCAYDVLRLRERRPTTSLEAITDSESNPVDFPDPSESPEDSALRAEMIQLINESLQKLPFEQRVALVLCDVQGMTYDEIAASTATSLGTVKSRINRGRAHMRTDLLRHRELIPARFRHEGS